MWTVFDGAEAASTVFHAACCEGYSTDEVSSHASAVVIRFAGVRVRGGRG